MKKLLALLCVIAIMLTFCACSTTSVETVVFSNFEDENTSTSSNEKVDENNSLTQNDSITENYGDSSTNQNDDSQNNNTDTNVNTGTNSKIDDPLKPDLNGATILIYDTRDTFSADATASKAQKARADMLQKIQKELNCKFDVKKVDETKLATLAATSASAGKPIGSIITTTLYASGTYISSNLVANLCKVSSLDLSKDYMNRGDVISSTGFGNGKYGVAYDTQSSTHCVFYNKRILDELGYDADYIYNLVDKGEWNISVYRKLAKEGMKDLDGKSGMSENDQWGQVMQDAHSVFAPNVLASMGVKKIKLENGKLILNMSDPKIMEALDLARGVVTVDGTCYENARGDAAVEFFSSGNTLFLYAGGVKANLLNKMKDEFGLVPAPKVDGAKDYTTAVDGNIGTMMIPAGLSAQEQYNAGAVIQAYNYLFNDVLEVQKNEYVNRYFCDEKSGDNWLLAIKKVTSEPTQCYSRISEAVLAGTERVFWDYFTKGESPATAIESTKSATQKALDELNAKIKDK